MKINHKLKKAKHLSKMFVKVLKRDGAYVVAERVCQTMRDFTGYSKIRMKKFEEEMNVAKSTDIGSIVFEKENHSKSTEIKNSKVDIIVCVHNALEDVRKCLHSVLENSGDNFNLIIVDDGSAEETREYLLHFSTQSGVSLVRNDQALGYTFAANIGLRKSQSDFSLLLNSDTIVTSGWLEKMVACANSDKKIGIVGPLSNTASWQSIPNVSLDGDWADNALPAGMTLEKWAELIAENSQRVYPRIPFLNGFCLMIKRAVVDDIGYFDEEHFGKGYGEENDYCLRARKRGWSLAVADDAYVFHAQSKSYSNEKRKVLCEAADKYLVEKHGREIIQQGVSYCAKSKILESIRASVAQISQRYEIRKEISEKWSGKKIAFVLPAKNVSGGSNIVLIEARSLKKNGIEVAIVNLEENRKSFEFHHPNNGIRVIYAKNESAIPDLVKDFDAVIATANFTVKWLKPLEKGANILGYYIQDYEPLFYKEGIKIFEEAKASYELISRIKLFTKTDWNKEIVEKKHKVKVASVGPSCDVDFFRPKSRMTKMIDGAVRIVAMVRPNSPRRGAKMTMQILKDIKNKYGKRVDIVIYGLEQKEIYQYKLDKNFNFTNLGLLNSKQVSILFNESDIFVDYSIYQAMGLGAMEAMSAGLAVIAPKEGGASSFIDNGLNGILVDTQSYKECIDALRDLIDDENLRKEMSSKALVGMQKFHPDFSSKRILEILFD